MTTVPQATELPPEATAKSVDFQQVFPLMSLIWFPGFVLMFGGKALDSHVAMYIGAGIFILGIVAGLLFAIALKRRNEEEAELTRQELAKNPRFTHLLEGEEVRAAALKAKQHELVRPLLRSAPMLLIGALIAITMVLTIIFR